MKQINATLKDFCFNTKDREFILSVINTYFSKQGADKRLSINDINQFNDYKIIYVLTEYVLQYPELVTVGIVARINGILETIKNSQLLRGAYCKQFLSEATSAGVVVDYITLSDGSVIGVSDTLIVKYSEIFTYKEPNYLHR